MKKFVSRLLIFTAIIALPAYIADITISKHLRPNGWSYAWNDVYDNKVNSNLVILGSSRALLHFDAQMIEDSLEVSTYNLGISNAHVELSYFRLIELLKHCSKKPKYITLEVGYLTMWTNNTFADHYQLFPFMLFNIDCHRCTRHLDGYDLSLFLVPILRYCGYYQTCYEKSLSFQNKKKEKKGQPFFLTRNSTLAYSSKGSATISRKHST